MKEKVYAVQVFLRSPIYINVSAMSLEEAEIKVEEMLLHPDGRGPEILIEALRENPPDDFELRDEGFEFGEGSFTLDT